MRLIIEEVQLLQDQEGEMNMNKLPLQGKIAVVAGPTRGAGRGIAVGLGAAGATVYCTGRSVTGTPSDLNRPETIQETARHQSPNKFLYRDRLVLLFSICLIHVSKRDRFSIIAFDSTDCYRRSADVTSYIFQLFLHIPLLLWRIHIETFPILFHSVHRHQYMHMRSTSYRISLCSDTEQAAGRGIPGTPAA